MPYIKQEERKEYKDTLNELINKLDNLDANSIKGHLNYLFFTLIQSQIKSRGLNYARCNDMMGVLESCKQELYRRIIAPYEDKKIEENGDV